MSGGSTDALSRSSLFAWQVSADQEEPWRRFLQELSGSRFEEYTDSRRRLGISAEYVWLAPKPSGGGVAIVLLEAEDPERALSESVAKLAAQETPLDSRLRKEVRNLFGYDFARPTRVANAELLFAWRESPHEEEQEPRKGS